MRLDGKTALVTGAAGFVGQAVVRRLLADGVAVRPGARFTEDDTGPAHVRLSPIQVADADIEPGIAALGRALRASVRPAAQP